VSESTLQTAFARPVTIQTADRGEVELYPLTFDDWANFEAWCIKNTPKGQSVVGRVGEALGSIRGMRRLLWMSLSKGAAKDKDGNPMLSLDDVWFMFGGTLAGMMAAHAELMRISGFNAEPVEEAPAANPPADDEPGEAPKPNRATKNSGENLPYFGDSPNTAGPTS
jgi:hypothetical protein